MRWSLAIDTCGAHGAVAVARDSVVIAKRILPARETQEHLMTAIVECLAEAGISTSDLHLLSVAHGPGSFTGVRIGVAAIKGMAEALGLPVIAVSRLRMMAKDGRTAWLDAGRGDVYAGDAAGEQMLSRTEAEARGGRVVVGEEILRGAGEWVGQPSIEDLVQAAGIEADAGRFGNALTLDANYLRVPDAELALRASQV